MTNCRPFLLGACIVIWTFIVGCKKESLSGSYVFFERDPTIQGGLADVLPACNSIVDMSVTFARLPGYGILNSNEMSPWHPSETERCSIFSQLKETQGITIKQVATVAGTIDVVDRQGNKFVVSVYFRSLEDGEVYSITADSKELKQKFYAPIGRDKTSLMDLFRSKSKAK